MRAYVLILVGVALSRAEASERVFDYAERVRGATIPFYEKGEPKPYAALRVERVFREYERRAFFRIGLLPMVVADNVTLRFLRPGRSAETLAMAARLAETAEAVEWRDVKLTFDNEPLPRLRAARMRPSSDKGWRIWGAIVRTGTNEAPFEGGHLSIEKGGAIFFHPTGGQKPINLLSTWIKSP